MVKHDRAVTANVRIPSVGDVSGRRIYIEDVYPLVDAGRFPIKRIVGEPVDVWADIFRDGHAVLAAELLWRPEASDKWSRVPMRLDANDRWTGSFTPPSPGRYVYAIEAWTDLFGTWRRDFLAQASSRQERQPRDRGGPQSPGALEAPRRGAGALDPRHPSHAHAGRRSVSVAVGRAGGSDRQGPAGRPHAQRELSTGGGATDRTRRRLVRNGAAQPRERPQPPRHVRRLHRPAARDRRVGVRCPLSPADPSHRAHQPQGTQQFVDCRSQRSRQPLCHRLRRGRPRRRPSRAWNARGLPAAGEGLRRPWNGGRARFRHPMLAGPSMARRASGMVQAPARRLDPIRGKPAEEIRGHRQPGLLRNRQRRTLASLARRRAVLGSPGGADLSGRQSAHQAVPVLGMADPRSPERSTPTSFSCRRPLPDRRS